jgi:hypothetical protein
MVIVTDGMGCRIVLSGGDLGREAADPAPFGLTVGCADFPSNGDVGGGDSNRV